MGSDKLAVVETTSDADLATEVSRRDTRISAADATLQAELDRLQGDVNFAHGELVAAQAAQDAQEIIKDAAIADRVLKESIFSEQQDEMESILQAVEAKISGEREAAQTQHDADVASSLAKKNSDVADCNAAEQAVIDKWDAKIADAQAAWDAAAVVEATESAEYERLFAIRVDKQELYDAALERQAVEGALARSLHKDDVDGAWDYYTSMHGSITSIATSDYAYLTEELESLQTVLDIVNQLNLDGDTNGEHVAAEHVTNDYATEAADAKAAYHGATINESNSEGRAGEGHAH